MTEYYPSPSQIFKRLVLIITFIAMALMLAGVKECREDYFFAVRASLRETPTVTPTETPTTTPTEEEEDDEGSSSSSSDDSSSSDSSSESSESSSSSSSATAVQGILPLMAQAEARAAAGVSSHSTAQIRSPQTKNGPSSNWLGNLGEADSDFDGLRDEEEQALGTDEYNADSDGDGVMDGDEVLYASDPLNPAALPFDIDGGGLDGSDEQAVDSTRQ